MSRMSFIMYGRRAHVAETLTMRNMTLPDHGHCAVEAGVQTETRVPTNKIFYTEGGSDLELARHQASDILLDFGLPVRC